MSERTYEYRGPVNPEKHEFVERGQVYTWMNHLLEGKRLMLVAPWQTGKTTQMLHLQRLLNKGDKAIGAYVDIAKHVASTESGFFQKLTGTISKQLGESYQLEVRDGKTFQTFLADMEQRKARKICLLYDNFDRWLWNIQGDWIHLSYDFRKLAEDFLYPLSLAMFSLTLDHGAFGPLRRIAHRVSLPDFDETEVADLMAEFEPPYQEQLREPVFSWTSGHPYLTNRLLCYLHERTLEGIGPDDLLKELPVSVARLFFEEEDLHFGRLNKLKFRSLTDADELDWFGLTSSLGDQTVIRNRIYRLFLKNRRVRPGWKLGNQRVSLQGIQLHRDRCFVDSHLEDLPVHAPWIFLTGENAYGKTCFLQAIAIALLGDDGAEALVDSDTKVSVRLAVDEETFDFHYENEQHHAPIDFAHLIGYGPSRLRFISDKDEEFGNAQNIHVFSLFKQKGVLLDLERDWLKDELLAKLSGDSHAGERIDKVLGLIAKLLPHVDDVSLDGTKGIRFTECGRKVRLNQLSAGHKSIFAMIGDLLIRLFRLTPDVVDPSELRGIVLIDELENHLHPKWQARFPVLLHETFPHIQFIASTHGVVPFIGAPEGSLVLKVFRDEEGVSKVKWLDNLRIEDLTPDSLLTSPIFDMEHIFNLRHKEPPTTLRTSGNYDYGEARDELEELMSRLDQGYQEYLRDKAADDQD